MTEKLAIVHFLGLETHIVLPSGSAYVFRWNRKGEANFDGVLKIRSLNFCLEGPWTYLLPVCVLLGSRNRASLWF